MNKSLTARLFNALFSTATTAAVPAAFNNVVRNMPVRQRGVGMTKAPSSKRAKGRAHKLADAR